MAARIAEASEELTRLCASDQRTDPVETITAELLPLCAALRWIASRGEKLLAPRRYGVLGRPVWLWGVHSVVHRDPHGHVLILGAWNYPLLLTGVQAAQALAAGNRVLVKPAPGCEESTARMVRAFHDAGVPPMALIQLDSSTQSAIAAMDAGVDLIVLTGSAATGRSVLQRAAQTLTPTIVELSGCDAVVILPDADIERAVDSIVFGLNFNSGATCIAPRRLIAENDTADRLKAALQRRLQGAPAKIVHPAARGHVADVIERSIRSGCIDALECFDGERLRQSGQMSPTVLDRVDVSHPIATADVFAPVTSIMRVAQIDDAVARVNDCPYRLAASVFGDRAAALEMADRLSVGSVAINDLIVPTADPRVPFGGRGQSGFGVTRGDAGLLAMTVPKTISVRRGKLMPHLNMPAASDEKVLTKALKFLNGSTIAARWRALFR